MENPAQIRPLSSLRRTGEKRLDNRAHLWLYVHDRTRGQGEGHEHQQDHHGAAADGDRQLRHGYRLRRLRPRLDLPAPGKGRIGNDARVYKLAEQPIPGWGSDARSFIECELALVAEAEELFEDAGHAIAWALAHTN